MSDQVGKHVSAVRRADMLKKTSAQRRFRLEKGRDCLGRRERVMTNPLRISCNVQILQ